ncbi:MAG TPA: transporter substrate-binding domain-containing protein [Xanthobacteraceae bacterium]|nr:transporter substrate-binding domain-containing protein [Xanthobacteraceae bacterium]
MLTGLASPAFAADASSSTRDIAPTGTLRVAIAVGPAASTFWATRDPASGEARGVTVELAKAAAAKLHVPLRLVEYQNSGEIAAAAAKDAWDISFMPADAEREKFVDQGPPYVVYESTYLVRAGSDIKALGDVDRRGIRVGAIEGTATSRTVAKSLRRASLATFPKPEAAAGLLGKGELALLCHKFHLWLRGRRRRQHGHRERAFAIAKASARRIVAIELGTCRCGRSGGASGSVITGKGIFFDWSGGTWS